MVTNFSKFKKDLIKNPLTFEFTLDDTEGSEVYVAKTTNIELILFQELSINNDLSDAEKTIKSFKIFLGDKKGLEVFNFLNIEGVELVLTTLMSKASGITVEDLIESAKSLNSPR